ncbi:MAG TPA: hypothetical protein V6C86_13340 [Oculatellaceae cyanobacterium]
MLTISYSETRNQGTLSTWQRCTLTTPSMAHGQAAELERLAKASGVLHIKEATLPPDQVLQGVHWTLVAEDESGRHRVIGKSARSPGLPLEDTDPAEDPESVDAAANPLNYDRLGELLEFLKPHLKSGFAA